MEQFILVYTHPTEGEHRFELTPGRSYRIGSRADNDIVVDQKDVSRRHAVLRVHDGSFHITDLDSKNGTFINGAKVVSETFSCGDMVHLSSARLVIIEVGTGSYPSNTPPAVEVFDEPGVEQAEETQKYRSEASMEDVITLLESTAAAVRRGTPAVPLRWGVDRLGFDGAMILYRDESNGVAMISSAGDLGGLERRTDLLSKLATDHKVTGAAGTRVRQIDETGGNLLAATVGSNHLLIVRYAGRPPAIGDLRSVIAAVGAVLGSGNVMGHGAGAAVSTSPSGVRPDGGPLDRVVGISEAIHRCRFEIEVAARARGPVVIIAERGAGCSLASRVIHDLSERALEPHVVIDLEGLDPRKIEERLVGAGTLATQAAAAGLGTLVLDRVMEMPEGLWEKILDVIATSGSERPRLALILNPDSASPVLDSAETGLKGEHVWVPALRQRLEDIPALACALLLGNEGLGPGRPIAFSRQALDLLMNYSWPGNVAELRREIGNAAAAALPETTVKAEHFPAALRRVSGGALDRELDLDALAAQQLAEARNDFESWLIRRVLAETGGRQSLAAQRLGISRAGLFKKMRKLGL